MGPSGHAPLNAQQFLFCKKNRFQNKLADFSGCENAKGHSASGLSPDHLTRGSAHGSRSLSPEGQYPRYKFALTMCPSNSGPPVTTTNACCIGELSDDNRTVDSVHNGDIQQT